MVLSGDYSVTNYRSQVDRAASIEKIAETGQTIYIYIWSENYITSIKDILNK